MFIIQFTLTKISQLALEHHQAILQYDVIHQRKDDLILEQLYIILSILLIYQLTDSEEYTQVIYSSNQLQSYHYTEKIPIVYLLLHIIYIFQFSLLNIREVETIIIRIHLANLFRCRSS